MSCPISTTKTWQPLGVSLGHRKKLLRAIASLSESGAADIAPAEAPKRAVTLPERRHLTVLFCDLVGSTELSTRLDPEDLRDIMQRFQEACVEVIHRYGGYVGNYIGDGILAYFGYPRAHEDDAQRAVRAGLDMIEAIAALNGAMPQQEIKLAIRVGINTGLVVVGDIGTGESRDEMAVVGETPNVAARLQALAEPGSVVIGAGTYRLIEGSFVCDDLGPLRGQGRERPGPCLPGARADRRVALRSHHDARTDAAGRARGRGAPAACRAGARPRTAKARWSCSRASPGSASRVSSRACASSSATSRASISSYFCSPFYSSSALYPVLDQLERAADFRRHDPPTLKLEKLEAAAGPGSLRACRGGGPARTAPVDPDRGPLPDAGPDAAAAPRQGVRDAPRPAVRPRQPRSGPDDLRGRPLDRSDLASSCSSWWSTGSSACRSCC